MTAGFVQTPLPMRKVPIVARDFIGLMRECCDAIKPFPGVGNMVVTLADAGVRIAVVSSNSGDNVAEVVGHRAPPGARCDESGRRETGVTGRLTFPARQR